MLAPYGDREESKYFLRSVIDQGHQALAWWPWLLSSTLLATLFKVSQPPARGKEVLVRGALEFGSLQRCHKAEACKRRVSCSSIDDSRATSSTDRAGVSVWKLTWLLI